MKYTKTVFPRFFPYDRRRIEKYLEEQAQKGWMFSEFGAIGWKFRRIEPKTIHFAVTYYADTSEFDSEATDGLVDFRDYCAKAGWKFMDANQNMQVFSSEGENPIPIETDVLAEIKNIHKIEKKRMVSGFLFAFAWIAIWFLAMAVLIHKDAVRVLCDGELILVFSVYLLSFMVVLLWIMEYYFWHRRAVKMAMQEGVFLDVKYGFRVSGMVTLICGISLLLLMFYYDWVSALLASTIYIVSILILWLIWEWIKEKGYSRRENRIRFFVIGFVVVVLLYKSFGFAAGKLGYTGKGVGFTGSEWEQYLQTPPLSFQDIYGEESECSSQTMWVEESWLVADYEMRSYGKLQGEGVSLSYGVVDVKCDMLYDLCLEGELRSELRYRGKYAPVDTAEWGADSVYRARISKTLWDNIWLLCYGDRIVVLVMDCEPTPEQMALVGEVLGN